MGNTNKKLKGDDCLDTSRAIQIMESHGVIEVLYNGAPVWLEGINGENADVSYIDTKKRAEVPVGQLFEGNGSE